MFVSRIESLFTVAWETAPSLVTGLPCGRSELPIDPYADDMSELVPVLHGVSEVESQPDPGHERIAFEGSQARVGAIGISRR
jgi:hypothetical protein